MTSSTRSRLPLACPVRGCGRALVCTPAVASCSMGHTFDRARSGYLSLVQPQDRRSTDAGDSKAEIDARRSALEAGLGRFILDAIVGRSAALIADGGVVVDLGCGAGDTLIALSGIRPIVGIGIDLSTAAAGVAARRSPAVTWIVANADRRLPILDASVDLVLSVHGRRNAPECARVLEPGGHLIVATPGREDLIELRERVQGRRVERDRIPSLIAEHGSWFVVEEQQEVRERHRLAGEPLRALLRGTYRGGRTSAAAAVERLEQLEVTLSSELVVFRRRPAPINPGNNRGKR